MFEADEKLLIQRITGGKNPLKVAYDDEKFYNKESINNLILKKNVPYNIKYILGLLNSRLINWLYSIKFTNASELTVNISKEYLSQIPIKNIPQELQKPLINLVDKILSLSKKLKEISENSNEWNSIKVEKEATDKKIDQLVYKFYDLTSE
ncbi:MAG: TaqI-like C-terminal specificity domain-containing protein, partial [bacterium]|nr:TaqI-like C-terminal specificity domain-containing protein [bacterium]